MRARPPARPAEPTDEARTFAFGGHDRSYLLALPDDYDGTTAHPLLLAFHGHGGSKEVAMAVSELGEKGPARGYVVVFADALGDRRRAGLRRRALERLYTGCLHG